MADINEIGLKYQKNHVSLALLSIGQPDTSVFWNPSSSNICSSNCIVDF